MKKLIIVILSLLICTEILAADERKVIIVNTSENHYMTVTYGFCGKHCTAPPFYQTVILYSKNNSTNQNKHYTTIEIPDDERGFSGVVLHKIVEKEIIDGKPTENIIAKARVISYICKSEIDEQEWRNSLPILQLDDLKGSPYIGCTKVFP